MISTSRGLTRDVVSERAGISCSAFSRLDAGFSVTTIETLIKLANSIRVPLPELLLRVGILKGSMTRRALAAFQKGNGMNDHAVREKPDRFG